MAASDHSEEADSLGARILAGSDYGNSLAKRAFDLIVASMGLIVSLPVLIFAVLVNTIITGGKPVFVQRRLGLNGREFGLYKLRTMRVRSDGEEWAPQTFENDERLTIIGKFLRSTYIDELPQFINVILGDMSVVGPRPETPEKTHTITVENPRFWNRLAVKPGITGLAQIFFRKPSNGQDLWRRYYYDQMYIKRCRLRLDIELSGRTVLAMLRYRGT